MKRHHEAFLFFLALFLVLGAFLAGCSLVWGYLGDWNARQLAIALRLDAVSAAAVAAWHSMQAYRRGSP